VHTGVARNRWFRLVLSLVDSLAVDPTSPMAMKTVSGWSTPGDRWLSSRRAGSRSPAA